MPYVGNGHCHDTMVSPLSTHGVQSASQPDDFKTFDIVRATQYGIYERVVELVECGFEVNQMDSENVSLLHWAAINNRLDIVK